MHSSNGIEVISLRNKQNRLERLFLDMVDRPPGAAGPGDLGEGRADGS